MVLPSGADTRTEQRKLNANDFSWLSVRSGRLACWWLSLSLGLVLLSFVLRVLVVFLSLAFPPFSGDFQGTFTFCLWTQGPPTQVPGLFRYPFTYDRPGVQLRSTLRALLYSTCGRLSELLPAAVMDYDRSGKPSFRGELVHRLN